MNKSLRDSGIEEIGAINWGTHIGGLFESEEDLYKVALPYIKAGLNNNELCLWVYSQNSSYEDIKNVIVNSVMDVDSYIEKGQLILISNKEWYLKDNTFYEIRVNTLWNKYINKAIEQGFDGLRVVADTSCVDKKYYRSFANYEEKASDFINQSTFIALCIYDAKKADPLQIAEVIKNHNFVIMRNEDKLQVVKSVELMIKNKQLNDVLEYDKLKTEFFSNISHEFKTPLNVILSIIQTLELKNNKKCDAKDLKYLKVMKQNCLRLVRLVNNVIDITKIDANYFNLRKQNCNIVSLVEDISLSIIDYAKNKGISLVFDTDVEEKIIACDPEQIERIVLNLLSNAIKFTRKGGHILVSLSDLNDKIQISVKDDGIGIPKDKQKSIFNRFEQVDKSLTREYEGSGIGLSIVKALVEKHNGTITLNSELGKGSEFIIELPCEVLEEKEAEARGSKDLFINDYTENVNIEFSDIYV